MKQTRSKNESSQGDAFTLLELVVAITAAALLALLTVPSLARTGQSSKTIQCLNNHRQLARAWIMYCDDNEGKLPPNPDISAIQTPAWVGGLLRWDLPPAAPYPDNTNSILLSGALLGPYCNRCTTIYKCPEDVVPGVRGQRVRSVSMNGQMAGVVIGNPQPINQYGGSLNYFIFHKRYEINRPTPALAWVFIDEHADSIDDGFFRVDMSSTTTWPEDIPASYHGGRGILSFADGHAETKDWQDSSIKGLPVRAVHQSSPVTSNPNTDLLWLQTRTTSLPQ